MAFWLDDVTGIPRVFTWTGYLSGGFLRSLKRGETLVDLHEKYSFLLPHGTHSFRNRGSYYSIFVRFL